MPASRIRQNKAKRPRIPSEDRTDGPEKRPRNGTESPLSSSPNSIHILRDRSRIAWQNKGKWRERTPKRTPMSLAQAADDLFTGTSAQGALVNAALSPQQLDTSILEIASTIHGSSPISPKDVPIPETPIMNQAEEKLQEEIERLRRQLEQKDQIITRHESTIETVQNCVYCPICLDPLWKPLVVVPCGHMACQGCLISWFTSPAPGHADEPDPPIRRKRKTCPHCRGTVTTRPVEIYGLGGAVAALHPQPPQPPSDIDASIDPWADIFQPPLLGPVRDNEDGGIRRCPTCFYEIFDGECVGCGRAFSDESGHTAFGSDDGSVSVFDDDPRSIYGGGGSLYGGTLYGDEGSDGGDSVYGAEIPVFDYPPRARVYDSYDEDEDEDDSFIDDAELPRPPPAAYFNHYAVSDSEEEPEDGGYLSARASRASPVPIHRVNSYTGSSSSSSSGLSDDDDEEDDFLPGRGRRGRSVETETLPETAEEADDEDDDEEDEASVNPNATIDLVSDDDDEPPVRSMGRRSAAERWGGWSRAEGEPPRGRSLSRRRVVSDGSEDGSEYFSD